MPPLGPEKYIPTPKSEAELAAEAELCRQVLRAYALMEALHETAEDKSSPLTAQYVAEGQDGALEYTRAWVQEPRRQYGSATDPLSLFTARVSRATDKPVRGSEVEHIRVSNKGHLSNITCPDLNTFQRAELMHEALETLGLIQQSRAGVATH